MQLAGALHAMHACKYGVKSNLQEGFEGLFSARNPAMDLCGDASCLAEVRPRGAVLKQLLLLTLDVHLDEVNSATLSHCLQWGQWGLTKLLQLSYTLMY